MGHIYILSNEAMPGLLKVGYTERTPEGRARELHTTGTPAPFVVEFAVELSGNTHQIEQRIHHRLHRFRPDRKREFFRIELREAVQRVAAFIVDEQHPVLNVYGNISDPFPEAHEKAERWAKIQAATRTRQQRIEAAKWKRLELDEQSRRAAELAAWEADAPRREADRVALLRERYEAWRKEHSHITKDDWFHAVLYSLVPVPLGGLGGIIVTGIAENMGVLYRVKRFNSRHLEGPYFQCLALGWCLTILGILFIYVKDKRKSKWGTIVPDEYKEVASR